MALEIFLSKAVGPLQCNCYVVGDRATNEAVVIDPGGDAGVLAAAISQGGLRITAIVATHAHFDHVLAAGHLREVTGAPFYLHDDDRPLLDWMQESGRLFLGVELPPPPEVDRAAPEGERLAAGAVELEVLHTPGHSPGSITLVHDEAIFGGDTLFAGSIGRTDLPGGDADTLVSAIKTKIFRFEDDVPVHPGHGPATSVGRERHHNPFVGNAARLWLPPHT